VFAAHVAEVVIATPDDSGRFRAAVGHAMNWWNGISAERHQIVLVSSIGQHDTAAEDLDLADKPAESLDHCDVFIAVFDPMRPDAEKVMGEVARAKRAGKLALVWLVAEPPSDGLGADDKAWLSDVTQRLTEEGTVPRFIGDGDSRFERRLQTAITDDLVSTNLSTLTVPLNSTAPNRHVTTYRTPVALLGPQIWAVTVMNHSTSLATDLTVRVDAVDAEGGDLHGGASRSRQPIADVFAKLRAGPWPDEHRPLIDPDVASPAPGPSLLTNRMDLLAAHTTLGFPRWLRPNQHASALYELEDNAAPLVHIQFEDESGEAWSRTNDAEPERVSSSTERHTSCPQMPAGPTFPSTT
jgi:hypothetical protein